MRQSLRIVISTLIIVAGLTLPLKAEQVGLMPVPVFQNVQVQSQVFFNLTTGLYTYSYTITNPVTNTGEIWSIDIDITKPQAGYNIH